MLAIIHLLGMQLLSAQITKHGVIRSKDNYNLKHSNKLPIISLPYFDVQQLIEEDKKNEKHSNKPFRFAKAFDVNIDIKKDGLEEEIPNSGNIWRLKVKSSGAYSLNIIFGKFELPIGAELFIYNVDKTQIVGALTKTNNNKAKVVPIQPIKGDELIIEYYEPNEIPFKGKLILSKIGHDYRGIFIKPITQDCNVDINCPEGNNWQNESHSVCRLLINASSYCTGSLVNNVNNDGRAYVLTANHCINSASDANNTVFVFNYERPVCSGAGGDVSQSISNSTLRANWVTSDFSLVELSSVPPNNYNPYWNGWDNQDNIPVEPVICIHHPTGDVKKISRDNAAPFDNGDMWGVTDWTVGTVEHGSSGAPFYNTNHRVVGQVHGGNNIFCNTNETSEYGKLSSSWNGGGTNATRLRNWLDPANTTNVLPGLRLIRNTAINASTLASGDIVRLQNVNIQGGSNVVIDINERFEAIGTFNVPVGSTLLIRPDN